MHELCPLCLKRGAKKNIKLLQINLQEAVWVCEEENCLWPFGYEDVEFSQRIVGETWSCYWKDYKPTAMRSKENVLVPIKTSLCETYTDPESESTSEKLITNVDIHCIDNTAISNSRNITNSMFVPNNLSASIPEKLDVPYVKTKEKGGEDDNVLNDKITINNADLNDINLQLLDNNKDIKIKTEAIDPLDIHIEDKDDVSSNVKNIRGAPRITSIEKTNIKISNMKAINEMSVYQDSSKELKAGLLKTKKPVNVKGSVSILKPKGLSHTEPIKNNSLVSESNLSVTKMEIDGLPPITLAYEISGFNTISEIMSNLKPCHKSSNTKPDNSEIKSTFAKQNLNSGKHYEKFSFNAIKKKIESSNTISNTNSNNSSSIKSNSGNQEAEHVPGNDTTEKKDGTDNHNSNIVNNDNKQVIVNMNPNVDTTCISKQISNSMTCSSSQEDIAPGTDALNTSANIDSFLEDFLANDHNVSMNDDWLNSLLN